MAGSMLLPLQVEQQAGHMLCWAAVCVALKRYYGHTPLPGQAEFARSVLGDNFDQACAPARALAAAGLQFGEFQRALALEELRAQIAAGHPVLACMRHFIGWHLVVLHGIRGEAGLVVADSLHGPGDCAYDDFRRAYRDHYDWSGTFVSSHVAARLP